MCLVTQCYSKAIVGGLTGKTFYVDTVIKTSKFHGKTTLMKHLIDEEETCSKMRLINFYYGEHIEYKIPKCSTDLEHWKKRDSNRIWLLVVDVV